MTQENGQNDVESDNQPLHSIKDSHNLDNTHDGEQVSGDVEKREQWGNQLEFMFSCIGYAIGLGNVWRFPYLCYANGGGVFLIPYFIALFCGGIPMFFLEVCLGQYLSAGGLSVWKICPIAKGVGYAGAIMACWLNIYYIVVLAWGLFYMYYSFAKVLPWQTCGHTWNTNNCIFNPSVKLKDCIERNNLTTPLPMSGPLYQQSMIHSPLKFNTTPLHHLENDCWALLVRANVSQSPIKEFWNRQALQITKSADDIGSVRWPLALTLLLGWILCYFCIWKGVRWSGKVVYFTSLFPYTLLFTLLIRGLTLEGAFNGIKFLFIPDFSKLFESQLWLDAVTQIFFSYGLGLGALIALGSYNQYGNNCLRNTLILTAFNEGTCFLAGLVIFSALGHMAHTEGKSIKEVATQGPGLTFYAYPAAISTLPLAPFWSVLFFLMLMFVGLDSQFGTLEGFITAIVDEFPKHLRKRRELFVGLVCTLSFLVGIIFVTQGGMYYFKILDYYAASGWALLLLMFAECIAISWCYGLNRFYDNIYDMVGFYPFIWFKITWLVLTPLLCFSIAIWAFIEESPAKYEDYNYPKWSIVMGWMIACSSILAIPVYAAKLWFTSTGTITEKFYKLVHVPSGTDRYKNHLKDGRESMPLMKNEEEDNMTSRA
ncbi:hypothetical protein SNEBB_001657 [Seison nebaliae]|nr:hypothetical protein SNEBB_001657 [Seison nebaliae]